MKYLFLSVIAFSLYSFLLAPSVLNDGGDTKAAVLEFLAALDDGQKQSVLFDIDHEKRKDWHFLPERSYPRTGLGLDKMNADQKAKLHRILGSALSEVGYEKTVAIMGLEDVLAELGEDPSYRNPELYTVAFFGDPAVDDVWSWSFGGHHLALSFTYVDGTLSMSPRFFGANPAVVLEGKRKGLAVLDSEEQGGLALINSMSMDQKKLAIITGEAYQNILTENKEHVEPLEVKGIAVAEMNKEQVGELRALIDVYLSSIPDELALARLEQIKNEDFSKVLFAWAGATEQFKAHYYRIQGSSFLIEFDNAQNNANHIHTVWRDFEGDFGRDLIREHREEHKH